MNFGDSYQKISNLVKGDIAELVKQLQAEIGLESGIDRAISEFLNGKSKRIRPVIAFLYLRASGYEPDERQYNLQTAVEILHNASLLHDDVIDESETRRGQNTINNQFNNKIAILSGDYLLAFALDKLNSLNCPQIVALCANTVREMCRGEIFQDLTRGKIPTLDQYLKKTEQKTAGLFRLAIEGALLLAGASDTKSAKEFALNFGTAFQIRDDLLNITGSQNLKPVKNDIQEGIYNAPVIFSGNTSELTKGIEKTKDLLNNYVIKSQKAVELLENNRYKTALRELLDLLNNV